MDYNIIVAMNTLGPVVKPPQWHSAGGIDMETIVIASLISAFFGFLIMAAAVAVGVILAANHLERRVARSGPVPSMQQVRTGAAVPAPPQVAPPAVNVQPPQWQ